MYKKEFIKAVESGDIDDTTEAWETLYDLIEKTVKKDTLQSIIDMVEESKKQFTEDDPNNIQDKEAYYTNLALTDIITKLKALQ